jgi:hypothetical protein
MGRYLLRAVLVLILLLVLKWRRLLAAPAPRYAARAPSARIGLTTEPSPT